MLVLISGPNSSGKSLFAEGLVSRAGSERFYIATMVPRTEDNRRRIEKHRAQRQGLNFTTLELPYEVGSAPVTPGSAVLLLDTQTTEHTTLSNAQLEDGQILPPISSLPGVGANAAESFVAARQGGPFISMDDMLKRKVPKGVIETLRQAGCLGDMPESSQVTLFEFGV